MGDRYIIKRTGESAELEVEGRKPAIMAAVSYCFARRKSGIEVLNTSSDHPDYMVLRIKPAGSMMQDAHGNYYLLPKAQIWGSLWAVDMFEALMADAIEIEVPVK